MKAKMLATTLLLAIFSTACVGAVTSMNDDTYVEVTEATIDIKPEIQQVVEVIPEVEIEIVEVEKVEEVEVKQEVIEEVTEPSEDEYLLAKIVMAEAEGECLDGKAMVAQVILNRVDSNEFPDTIREVIFQERNGVYQFSPIGDGRFDRVEPSDDCWKAVELVLDGRFEEYDVLYFTARKEASTWHSRNLEFAFEIGGHKFYK